jgi:O-antigen/teichoic acid export membrane protein
VAFDKRQYLRNAVANQGAFLVSVAVALVLSPLVVKSLGDESYGYWTLVMSLTSYYSFIDLGIRSAVTQYVARYLAAGDRDNLTRTINTSLAVLSGIAVFICAVAAAMAIFFPRLFDVDPEKWVGLRAAVVICGVSMALRFPTGVFHAVITGNQRWDIFGFVQIAIRLLNAGLTVMALKMGYSLVGLAVVTLASQLVETAVMFAFSKRMTPDVPYRATRFDAESFKRIRNYGFYSFVIHICEQVIFYTDNLVVGGALGAVAVTYFAIGSNLIPYMDNLVLAMSAQLQQVVVKYDTQGDGSGLRILFVTGSRYLFALTCLIFANIAVVGVDFLGVWMGEKYVSGDGLGQAGSVLLILALAHLFHNLPTVARQILFGMNKNNLLALTSAIDAALKIVLSLVLVRTHGLIGVAVGTLIPMFLMSGVAVPMVVGRLLGVKALDFFRTAALSNLVVTAVSVGLGTAALHYGPLEGWYKVVGGAVLVTLLHGAMTWSFILDAETRARLSGMIKSRLGKSAQG